MLWVSAEDRLEHKYSNQTTVDWDFSVQLYLLEKKNMINMTTLILIQFCALADHFF